MEALSSAEFWNNFRCFTVTFEIPTPVDVSLLRFYLHHGSWWLVRTCLKSPSSSTNCPKTMPDQSRMESWTVFGTLSVIPVYDTLAFRVADTICCKLYHKRVQTSLSSPKCPSSVTSSVVDFLRNKGFLRICPVNMAVPERLLAYRWLVVGMSGYPQKYLSVVQRTCTKWVVFSVFPGIISSPAYCCKILSKLSRSRSIASSAIIRCLSMYNFCLCPPCIFRSVIYVTIVAAHAWTWSDQTTFSSTYLASSQLFAINGKNYSTTRTTASVWNSSTNAVLSSPSASNFCSLCHHPDSTSSAFTVPAFGISITPPAHRPNVSYLSVFQFIRNNGSGALEICSFLHNGQFSLITFLRLKRTSQLSL